MAALLGVIVSTSAHAAVAITQVSIQGIGTPYTWDTDNGVNNTVFITQYVGASAFNDNNTSQSIMIPMLTGGAAFSILGDGQPANGTAEAASAYLITVMFSNGLTIGGIYSSALKSNPDGGFLGTDVQTIDDVTYSLSSFDWTRSTGRGSDTVGPKQTGRGGDTHDYSGQFAISIVSVPEPATWGMMLAGFGMIGAGLRLRQKVRPRITYA